MTKAQSKYEAARKLRTPPHVSIRTLRVVSGLTLDQLIGRMQEATGRSFSRGAMSAIESGLRGASAEVVEALELAYGLEPGAIDTNYERRASTAAARVPA
ncbi:helix-turn-helix domain-containing protein [Williamsia soli]|uniref:helix-turn-helix domain-containing protein n=1 Tax=Williamsia soli TaxID=364929 RepID=UPI001A9EF119|nr:helix-turn-helix transcriptional regulator [Williamsia soli]